MGKTPIKRGQIWKQKGTSMYVQIIGTSGGKWKTKVLSDKLGVYKGSHTMTQQTIWSRYELQ
jgi:hypothetical protein